MGNKESLLPEQREHLAPSSTESILLSNKIGSKRDQRFLELIINGITSSPSTRPLCVKLGLRICIVVLR
jgi:hypothetical protein